MKKLTLILTAALAMTFVAGCATTKGNTRPRQVKKLVKPTEQLIPIATYRVKQMVGMFYQLNLYENNYLARGMAEVMDKNDSKIRSCYTGRLRSKPKLSGNMALSFKVTKSMGRMQNLSHVGGDLYDQPLFNCVAKKLAALKFKAPHNLKGKLVYTFSVNDAGGEFAEAGPTPARLELDIPGA